MATTYWTYGDTKTDFIDQLVDQGGSYPSLASVSTVTLKLKRAGETTISLTGAVHDSATGKVRWRPSADQSEYGTTSGKINVGEYEYQWYVVWSDNRELTFPSRGNGKLVVKDDL